MESTNKNELQNASKPKNAISYKEAKGLQQEFLTTRANTLNKALNFKQKIKGQDVRDVTFDLQEMKQYIAYVEAEAKKKGLNGLGLRVYFGAYPKNDTKTKSPGYSTVFFMPTHQSKSSKGQDEIIEGVDGLNRATNGIPPNDLN